MPTYSTSETLLGTALAPVDLTRAVGLVLAFSLFNALAAQFSINIGPVPITGQTFAVTLTGALLGSRLGAAALIAYLIEGASGLPFFNNGLGGLGVLIGPTGGYLVSFPAAAYITGAFAEHGWDKRFWSAALAMLIGSIVILLTGWCWLMVLLHATPVAAFEIGVKNFIIGDIVKVIAAAAVLPTGWAILNRKASEKTEDRKP
ncbi:MAG: biotin transporter BioY [Blastocatellia bacterium]|nr:MAG: biotin transporter BioY [Blastocatellia bacterium]